MRRLFALLVLVATPALAVDRHVFLDTDADDKLNQCPNPAHNTFNTPSTANLQYCPAGSNAGKVLGDKSGYVSSCPGSTATDIPETGVTADIDGDGTPEGIHGSPQACVWNMEKSASCEIHAGTYRASGAYADENATNNQSVGGVASTCDRTDCWFASVVAWGEGPNLDGTGYGTSGSPGYLRGAVMNGSTDTWDSDGDKIPDTVSGEPTSYPAIISGDRDNGGVGDFDTTTCVSGNCSGDAFYAVIVGCGGANGYGSSYCRVTPGSGATRVQFDTNADGTFDTGGGAFAWDSREAHHLIIKDLEAKGYNGGNGISSSGGSARIREGMISLEGNDNSTDGLKIDHLYIHDNDYSTTNPITGGLENNWAVFSDSHNGGCVGNLEIKNSLIYQNNEKVIDDDCGESSDCGCPKNFHDNRVIQLVTSSRVRSSFTVFAYIKSVDVYGGGLIKAHRFWNNEFIYKAGVGRFMDLQAFGNSRSQGKGQIWVYGNLFRAAPDMTTSPSRWAAYSCSTDLRRCSDETTACSSNTFCTGNGSIQCTGPAQCVGVGDGTCNNECKTIGNGVCDTLFGSKKWRLYFFNNTFDISYPIDAICNPLYTNEFAIEKNNAYFRPNTIHAIGGTVSSSCPTAENAGSACVVRENEVCSSSASNCALPNPNARTDWFSPGSYAVNEPDLWEGLTNYKAKDPGPLNEISTNNACDPDDDGTVGVDYDWDGINDTTWVDIAGQTVICSSISGALDVGAIQSASDTGTGQTCGNNIREGTEVCDGSALNSQTCLTVPGGFNGGILACATSCAAFDTSGCTTSTVQNSKIQGVKIQGGKVQ